MIWRDLPPNETEKAKEGKRRRFLKRGRVWLLSRLLREGHGISSSWILHENLSAILVTQEGRTFLSWLYKARDSSTTFFNRHDGKEY